MSPTAENTQSTHTETPPNGQSPPQTTANKPYPAPEAEYQEIAQNPNLLLDKLQGFHQSSGTNFNFARVASTTFSMPPMRVHSMPARDATHELIAGIRALTKTYVLEATYITTMTEGCFLLPESWRKYDFRLLRGPYYWGEDFRSTSPFCGGHVSRWHSKGTQRQCQRRAYPVLPQLAATTFILQVLTDRKWKEVILVFRFPSTITSASFVLRKYYMSLLYDFEQVYYFRKKVPSMYAAESPGSTVNGSAPLHVLEDDAPMNQFSESSYLESGSKVTGTIDAKFDFGYLVSVNLGSERLNGVLYHIPTDLHMSQSCDPYTAPPHQSRKRYQLAARDPSRPKPNRRDYNISFAEHHTYLKPLQQEDWTSVEQTN